MAALVIGLLQLHVHAAEPTAEVSVRVVPVSTTAAGSTTVLTGRIEAVRQAVVAAQTGGNVLALEVEAGDRVRAGQTLVRIDPRQAKAALSSAEGAVAQARAQAANAKQAYDRTVSLRNQGFVSASALDSARAQHDAAQAALKAANGQRQQAELARGYTRVVAPFDGVVQATQVQVGDLAGAGSPVATVYAPGRMRAVVSLTARDAAAAQGPDKSPSAARIHITLADGQQVQPISVTPLPVTDPVAQTVTWRLELPESAGTALLPGQSVRVQIDGSSAGVGQGTAPLSVPAAAVLRRGELTAVYLPRDGGFALRTVRVGPASADGQVPVLAGLQPDDHVAVDAVRAGLAGARPQTGAPTPQTPASAP